MLYDSERARQPKADTPDRTTRRAAQRPKAEPVPAPRDGPAGTANAGRTQVTEHRLLSVEELERLAARLQQAVNDFANSPRHAVEEADSALAEMVTYLTNALAARQSALRANWQGQGTRAETDELRVALEQYWETANRVLAI